MRTVFNTRALNAVVSLPRVRRVVESKLRNGESFINLNFGKILETMNIDLDSVGNQYFNFVTALRNTMADLS